MSSSANEYTPQRVFDETVRHLASMPGPSMVSRPSGKLCAYRGIGGSRCAVGYWIPDDSYDSKLEATAVNGATGSRKVQIVLPEPLRTRPMLNLLGELQRAHDCSSHHDMATGTWNKPPLIMALRDIAIKRRLRLGVIKECFPT